VLKRDNDRDRDRHRDRDRDKHIEGRCRGHRKYIRQARILSASNARLTRPNQTIDLYKMFFENSEVNPLFSFLLVLAKPQNLQIFFSNLTSILW